MEDCIFCKLIKGELPRKFEYEDDKVVAFKSNKPAAEIHILIVPKKHVATFLDLSGEMNNLVQAAQKVIHDKKIESGYKLAVNGGKYQEVQHFHLHLLAGELEYKP
jgi:histidine triad (HIT) family protein